MNDTTSLQDQSRDDADDREDVDDVYMESVEAVSFSNVIGEFFCNLDIENWIILEKKKIWVI